MRLGRRPINRFGVLGRARRENTMRRFILAMSVLALVLGATCGDAFATHSPAAQQEVVGVDKTGALYALFLPHDWNGRLVVYAHGFVDPAAPVALPDSAPVDVAPWVVELRETLLQSGYGGPRMFCHPHDRRQSFEL